MVRFVVKKVSIICSRPICISKINSWFVLVEDDSGRLVRIFGNSRDEVEDIKVGDIVKKKGVKYNG